MFRLKYFAISFLVVLVSGCASTSGEIFHLEKISAVESVIYVYRKKQLTGAASSIKPRLYVNGNKIAGLKMGGYIPVKVAPGIVNLSLVNTIFGAEVDKPYSLTSFEIKAGEVMYFRYSQSISGFNNYGGTMVADGKSHLVPIKSEVAESEIKSYRQLKRLENYQVSKPN